LITFKYTSAAYTKDGKQVYDAPPHFVNYGLVGGTATLTLTHILSLYEEAIKIGIRCCKKKGYIYIKVQNQVAIHMTHEVQQIVNKLEVPLKYQRIFEYILSAALSNIIYISLIF
jgi:hypothetical protein